MATQRFYDGQPGPDIRRELNNFEAILDGTVAAAQDASTDAISASVKAQQWADAAPGVEVETGKYSAKHWADRAQTTVTGGLIYRGSHSAASGTFPATPSLGDYYKINAAGTLGGVDYSVGDSIIYNGTDWDKIDSTDAVTSVAGRVGAVVLTKGDVGLSNVDNTSDANKPLSAATQAALNTKVDKVAGKQLSTEDYTTAAKSKLSGVAAGANNYSHPEGDGNQHVPATGTTNNGKVLKAGSAVGSAAWGNVKYSEVTGTPALGTAASRDVAATGNASAAQVVLGTDTRLSDDRPASDVSSWAKAATKPTYTGSEVGLGNVDNTSDANKPISTATWVALNGKQASLGFTPVQQGGAPGQGPNKVFIGWATDGSGLLCQVDTTNFGKTWPINVAGTAARVVNPYISPAVEQTGDIGAAYVNWATSATPALQLNTPNSGAAYMVWRATHWGTRHVAAMHVYEGNMTVTMSVGNLNNFTWDGSGNFTATGNVNALSDIRLKTDITKITDALSKVSRLNGYTYTRKDTGARQTGVVAQELQEVLPEAVLDNGEHLAVAYGNIVGLLIEAIKELKSEVDQLKEK